MGRGAEIIETGVKDLVRLDLALRTLGFDSIRFDDLTPTTGQRLEDRQPPDESLLLELERPARWEFIMAQLRELHRRSRFMALRPDHRDLGIVLADERPELMQPAEAKDYIQHIADILRRLSSSARRFTVSAETTRALDRLVRAGADFRRSFAALAAVRIASADPRVAAVSTGGTLIASLVARVTNSSGMSREQAVGELESAGLVHDLERLEIDSVLEAVSVISSLLNFSGQFRCVLVLIGDVDDELADSWSAENQRVHRLSGNIRGLKSVVAEAWLWDPKRGRVVDAHTGISARIHGRPLRHLSADTLARALKFAA